MNQEAVNVKHRIHCTGYSIERENDYVLFKIKFDSNGRDINGQLFDIMKKTLLAGTKNFVVDLGNCDFPTYNVWATLLKLLRELKSVDGNLKLIWNPNLKDPIFNITGAQKLFDIYPNSDFLIN